MKLTKVLTAIGEEKTASDSSSAPIAAGAGSEKIASGATAEKLRTALREATSPITPTEKTASAPTPVGDLMKTASNVATAEYEALVKEAQLYGAAAADGFMVRLTQYNEAAEKLAGQTNTKVAAAAPVASNDDSFEKFAQENPSLVKEAAELGFATTMNQMEKLASTAWEKGYNQAVEQIYKTAHAAFIRGFEDVAALLTERR